MIFPVSFAFYHTLNEACILHKPYTKVSLCKTNSKQKMLMIDTLQFLAAYVIIHRVHTVHLVSRTITILQTILLLN